MAPPAFPTVDGHPLTTPLVGNAKSLQDLPKELLEGMYARLKACEIRMDEGDMFESEVITFVAPKLSGWLKKRSGGMIGTWKVSVRAFRPCT